MKKFFLVILLATISLSACGKKGPLVQPKDRVRFENIVDENE